MSSSDSPDAPGTHRNFRRRPGKQPERSNFAQTCTLLRQYFKEKGAQAAYKAISDASTAVPATTMSLLPNTGKPTVTEKNLFPNTPDLNAEPSAGEVEIRRPGETAQMTIFYAGKVIVYDDIPADKAEGMMSEAEKYGNRYCVSQGDNIKFSSVIVREPKQGPPQANGSDLPIPIATRSSLHRFFSKRKDRAAAKAPYQVNGHSNPPQPEAGRSSDQWPDVEILEGQSSKQPIDLNL